MNRKKSLAFAVVAALSLIGLSAHTAFASSYTSAQVAAHNTAGDCWEIINGNVYDLTSFIAQHPGGQAAIIAACGKDATAAFQSGPHSASSLNAISSLKVGDLASTATQASSVATDTSAATPPPTPSLVTVTTSDADSASAMQHENERDDNESLGEGVLSGDTGANEEDIQTAADRSLSHDGDDHDQSERGSSDNERESEGSDD